MEPEKDNVPPVENPPIPEIKTPATEIGGVETAESLKSKEFQESLKELKALASKDGPTTGYEIVQRLISDNFLNPFDVLMLGPEASEEEIKKQHKNVFFVNISIN